MAKDSATMEPEVGISSALPERQMLGAMEAHERDKAQRRKDFEKVRPVLSKCVDPDVAARYERKKPRFMFEVSMNIMERDEKTKKFRQSSYAATVEAMTEDDAWAIACDQLRKWPNRRSTDHKIIRTGNANQ